MNKIWYVSNYLIMQQLGGSKKKWTTLEHNGVMFPPEYEQHFVPVIYNGKEIVLDKEAEEYATMYAKFIDSEYIKSKIFNRNFWTDWKKVLGPNSPISSLDGCDFRLINDYLVDQKEQKKNRSPEEKKIEKEAKEKAEEKYKFAIVDGKKEPVGNFRIEPPGIFLGRGINPKSGMVKPRIYPEDITINIGLNARIPDTLPGHHWKQIVHDQSIEWLASWPDVITGKIKYVWLGAHSDLKSKNDLIKFDLARKLKRKIKKIRKENELMMRNDDPKNRQLATALYFIDNFALRVGNEKGEDETDTVGVTSLRVEHIELLPNNTIKLDFLGKDSVRYNRQIVVDPIVYQNIAEFIFGKNPTDQLFNLVSSADINKYLQEFMKDLTAKVFRTYNASNLFQKELNKISAKYDSYNLEDKINILLDEFNKANGKVAVLCNHQKNIAKNTNAQLDNLNQMIRKAKQKLAKEKKSKKKSPVKIKKMEEMIKKLKAKKTLKTELKNISVGTSKSSYLDPRITINFIKKHNIPIDKVFSKTLQEKFKWALNVDPNFIF